MAGLLAQNASVDVRARFGALGASATVEVVAVLTACAAALFVPRGGCCKLDAISVKGCLTELVEEVEVGEEVALPSLDLVTDGFIKEDDVGMGAGELGGKEVVDEVTVSCRFLPSHGEEKIDDLGGFMPRSRPISRGRDSPSRLWRFKADLYRSDTANTLFRSSKVMEG